MREIAREVGAYLLADIAHIAGLVATGLHPSPVEHADFVTTTTHKTLRGPRGGLVLCKEKYAKEIDSQTFPGIQGGPLMHVIAAKAVCFHEALQPGFKAYQQQIVKNARALAEGDRLPASLRAGCAGAAARVTGHQRAGGRPRLRRAEGAGFPAPPRAPLVTGTP